MAVEEKRAREGEVMSIRLIDLAKQAIDKIHQNQIGSLQERLHALQEIQEHVDFLVGAVREDISREEAE